MASLAMAPGSGDGMEQREACASLLYRTVPSLDRSRIDKSRICHFPYESFPYQPAPISTRSHISPSPVSIVPRPNLALVDVFPYQSSTVSSYFLFESFPFGTVPLTNRCLIKVLEPRSYSSSLGALKVPDLYDSGSLIAAGYVLPYRFLFVPA